MKTYILLDRSGSMSVQWKETVDAINSYVKKLKGKQDICLMLFDSIGDVPHFEIVCDGSKSKWKKIDAKKFPPRGRTPLNDAIAHMSFKMLREHHDRAVFVVMTDGYENSSTTWNLKTTNAVLDEVKMRDYQIVFLGANFDDIKEQATSYGVSSLKRGIVSNDIGSTYSILADKVNDYATSSATDSETLAATMDWSDQEQFVAKGK